jgi:hypothetical protein
MTMMNKHMKIVAIAGAAIVALAIGLLVGFATKENDTTTVVTTSSALAAYGTTNDDSTTATSYETTTIYQSSEGGSKSGKGSYEYYSGKSGKGVKGGKCKWKYIKTKHDMNIRVESVLSLIFSHTTLGFFFHLLKCRLFLCSWHAAAYYGKSYGMMGSMPITIEYFEKSGKGSKGSKGYSSKGSKGYSSKGSKAYGSKGSKAYGSKGSKAYGSKGSKGYGSSKVSKGYGTYYTEHVNVEGDSGDYTSDWEGGRF